MGSGEAWGFNFHGQHNVMAMIKHLVETQGLGTGPADELVFGGWSAGARGAMVHLDSVVAYLKDNALNPVKTLGMLDSPLYMDMDAMTPDRTTLAD